MTMPGRGNIPHEYGFSCWDLRLEQVGAGGPWLGAGERISQDQPLSLLGPGILMHPLHQDQGRRSWGETFHLHMEVAAGGGPMPGSSRPFQVQSVFKGAGCTAGQPGRHVPSRNPRSPAFLGPSRVAAVPGRAPPSAGRSVPSPWSSGWTRTHLASEPPEPPNPFLGRNF